MISLFNASEAGQQVDDDSACHDKNCSGKGQGHAQGGDLKHPWTKSKRLHPEELPETKNYSRAGKSNDV